MDVETGGILGKRKADSSDEEGEDDIFPGRK